MPANASFTVNDGKATPTSHAFVPGKIDQNNVALFSENVGSTLLGRPTFSYGVSGGTGGSAFKVRMQLNMPKAVEVIDSTGKTVVTVVHTPIAKAEFVFQATTSAVERKDLRVMLANCLLHATLGSAVDNVESFW